MKVDLFICRSLYRACVFKRFPAYVVWELWKREWRSVENYMSCFFLFFPCSKLIALVYFAYVHLSARFSCNFFLFTFTGYH